jgi:hypothetical protein
VIFNRFEPRSVSIILALLSFPPYFILCFRYPWYAIPLLEFIKSAIVYLGSLSLSTVIYRLSPLHPLAHIPGPLICKITRLWAVYITSKGKQHIYYKSLHDKYGTHVRTGITLPISFHLQTIRIFCKVLTMFSSATSRL